MVNYVYSVNFLVVIVRIGGDCMQLRCVFGCCIEYGCTKRSFVMPMGG